MNDDVGRLVGEDEPHADDELEGLGALCVKLRQKRRIVASRRIAQFFAQFLKRGIGAHDPGDAVAVGDANSAMAEQQRRQRHV